MTTRTGRRRPLSALWRERTRSLGALLALLAVATVVVWATRDRQPVEVVEMGFSPVEAVGENPGGSGVSWGAIVENTSDQAADGAVLRMIYHDADGNTAERYQTVDVLPGQRLGVGEDFSDHRSMRELSGPVVDVEVTVDQVESWRSPTASGAVAVDDVWAGHSPDGELAWSFVARSREGEPAGRIVGGSAVFRNADGEIVGGSSDARVHRSSDGEVVPPQPDRPLQGWAVMPVDIPDASTVEVYVRNGVGQP